jgi:hypothetical protein
MVGCSQRIGAGMACVRPNERRGSPVPYASNNNAVLIDGGCNNLQNLSVLVAVTEDIATTNNGGWSLQLNCFPPPGRYCQTNNPLYQLNWFQYIVIVQGGSLASYIQYWTINAQAGWPSGYTPLPNTAPWLPCWAHDYGTTTTFASISGDTLPRQSTLQIALGTDESGGVTSATFTYTDPDGNNHPTVFTPPANAVHPIVGCTLNFVGAPGGSANFTQGLTSSRAEIYYSLSSGELSVQNGGPGAACGELEPQTGETSNMTYSDINGAPAGTVTQILQGSVPCVVDHLFADDQVHLGAMRQIREKELAQHAAGHRIMEILDRHSADLAVLLMSDSRLRQSAQGLLTKASQISRDGGVFDDDIIDDALEVLKQASCELPPSMQSVRPAGETILESLRGRTLEAGLKIASRTIRPRLQTPSEVGSI